MDDANSTAAPPPPPAPPTQPPSPPAPPPLRLSARLRCLATKVPPGTVVADIGTDHALLPLYLAKQGTAAHVIATEIRPGPLAVARLAVERYGLGDIIEVRGGSGLAPLRPGEVDVAIIAGMGGRQIAKILDAGAQVRWSLERLVLEPNNGAEMLRAWLFENGAFIIDEDLVYEEGHFYEIIVVAPGTARVDPAYQDLPFSHQLAFFVGPLLFKAKHPLLRPLLLVKLGQCREAMARAATGKSQAAAERTQRCYNLAASLQEVIAWLPPPPSASPSPL